MIELEVAGALDGERVDRVVALVTDLSRARAAELVEAGAVAVDGREVTLRSTRVRAGQGVAIRWSGEPEPSGPQADASVAFEVVHADDHVVVVDKPAGLVVHPGSGVAGTTLVNGLLARFPELAEVGEPDRPGIVHRLDRGTSGLLVVARSAAAYDALARDLAEHRVERTYQALVSGEVASATGLVDAPIGRSGHDPTRRAVRQDGRPARTRYRVEGRFTEPVEATALRLELETGRTHQIRVHLQAIGHPVMGDSRYGGRVPEGVRLTRPFLHAVGLAFTHPATGRPVSFLSPLADDLAAVLARFR